MKLVKRRFFERVIRGPLLIGILSKVILALLAETKRPAYSIHSCLLKATIFPDFGTNRELTATLPSGSDLVVTGDTPRVSVDSFVTDFRLLCG